MEQQVEITLTNLMTVKDNIQQGVDQLHQAGDKVLSILDGQDKLQAEQAGKTSVSFAKQEHLHQEVATAVKQIPEGQEALKQHMDNQPKATVQQKTIRVFPEFRSEGHYRLLFRCFNIVMVTILAFILLAKMFNIYFTKG